MLHIADKTFESHLFTGTGKFAAPEVMVEAIRASGSQLVTLAMKRVDLRQRNDAILAPLLAAGVSLLPNTSGAKTAEEAVFAARLAREALGTHWLKLEIHPDARWLLPDPIETLKAAELLVREGFVVLPYCGADPVLCKRLEEVGCAAVMPLGAPIGSNQGLETKAMLEIIIEQATVPVVVDAGIGVPSHAAQALEMGAGRGAGQYRHCRRRRPRGHGPRLPYGDRCRITGASGRTGGTQYAGAGHQPAHRIPGGAGMKTFSDRWRQLEWDDIRLRINSKTAADVERALAAKQLTRDDMMALLSPAAANYLEPLAQRAQRLTRQRFGNTVSFYVPLYLSNLCANDCTYCGFSMSNRIKRKTLDAAEIARECAAIRNLGFEHLLLVTGEHQGKVGMDYFRQHLPAIRSQFASLHMEVQPLATEEYAELKTLGLDGVMVYQETYHESMYAQHHLKGKKQDFFWRLDTPDRLGAAGIDKIGLGALIGLSDSWRVDCFIVAEHLLWLQQRYWRSRYSVSFPRLRPCAGGIEPASLMDERQLVQTICAFRLLAPEVELSLSTRESPWFRDRVIPLAINNVSAFSKTQPGGYADDHPELEQFAPHDDRRPEEVASALAARGLQPVWKDWDSWLGRASQTS
ncbi:thiazole biosynthesis protein ThiH [Klebsiella pneumoniae]|nr:thiazole biosynthesis protein ThiH [Klebsiella pneumoniae]